VHQALQDKEARWEVLERPDLQGILELQAQTGHLAHRDHRDPVVTQVSLDFRELMERPELQGQVDHVVSPEQMEQLGLMEEQECLVRLVKMVRLELMGQRDRQD